MSENIPLFISSSTDLILELGAVLANVPVLNKVLETESKSSAFLHRNSDSKLVQGATSLAFFLKTVLQTANKVSVTLSVFCD